MTYSWQAASLPVLMVMLVLTSGTSLIWNLPKQAGGTLQTEDLQPGYWATIHAPASWEQHQNTPPQNTFKRRKRQDEVLHSTPANLRVVSIGQDYVDLEWQYGEEGVEFLVNVYYSGEQFAKDQFARGTSARVGGLAPGTDYTLRVKAFKALPHARRAYSAESEPVSATTQDVVIPKPSNLRVLTTNSEYIDIDWQFDGDQRDVEYTVKVFYSSGVLAKEQGSRVASARVGELAPSTDYTVSVMAFKALPRGRRANSPDSDPVSVRTQGTSPPVTPPTRPTTPPPPPTRPTTPPPPPTRPTTPPPPPTRPTTPPPPSTRPTTPPPPTPAGCGEGLCSCPSPNERFCVFCQSMETCNNLDKEEACSVVPERNDINMTVSVLSCGFQIIVNVEGIVRENGGLVCGTSKGVPVETVVMAECWGSVTLLAQCRPDGMWHPYGKNQGQAPSTQHLCQDNIVNSPVCGKRPRYRSLGASNPLNRKQQPQWPWLAAVIINGNHGCTATVITHDYVLSAAHCLTRSQASSQAVNAEDIRVQHIQTNGQLVTSYISSVHLFPDYKPGRRPSNDVSLLRLKNAITFSYHIQPACVLTQDFPGEKTAVTFKHQSGDYNWDVILQQHDSRCDSAHSACSRATNIDSNQFCANDIVSERFLEEGSSGGPYLVNVGTRAQDQWVVAGLVTFHTQDTCGKPLTIFTSLVNFWPWISQCVHEGKCTT
nr:uncharacterized protein LOC128692434 isoform X2 [Cherax quadricarinatus]